MATAGQWVQGARPRTLGAAVSPVIVGTAAATLGDAVRWWRAGAALAVALALQVGVNYANDYSDGVRGTDTVRRGPIRLTASGLATATAVRRAAALALLTGAAIGAALSIAVDARLLVLGVACVALAVLYTGGPKPLGYVGLGELMVLACFGFAACAGSAYVQHRHVPGAAWWGCLVVGLPAVAILLANNIRDIDGDRVAGKLTLAVRIGARRARGLFAVSIAGSLLAVVAIGARHHRAFVALAAGLLAIGPLRLIRMSDAPSLVRALVDTARFQLVLSSVLAIALWTS